MMSAPFDEGLRGKELWLRVRKHIEANPETWSQGFWAARLGLSLDDLKLERVQAGYEGRLNVKLTEPCNTAYCVAGWAVLFCGDPLAFYPGHDLSTTCLSGASVHSRAAGFLELSAWQSDLLFRGTNTVQRLDQLAGQFWR